MNGVAVIPDKNGRALMTRPVPAGCPPGHRLFSVPAGIKIIIRKLYPFHSIAFSISINYFPSIFLFCQVILFVWFFIHHFCPNAAPGLYMLRPLMDGSASICLSTLPELHIYSPSSDIVYPLLGFITLIGCCPVLPDSEHR
ncbi:MAG: hypothetical protein LBF63_00960 [Treponema sp.]|jgi:hypothetical protein|nr:hypothetical protein [Treponema sp.]